MKLACLVGAVAGAALVAGCGPSLEQPSLVPVGAQAQEIIGGTVDSSDPAVVALALPVGGGAYDEFCTGTLVGPKTVLTAAHCVGDYGVNQFSIVFGGTTARPTRVVRVAAQVRDPAYDPNSSGNDFGLIRLATAVTDVTPVPMNAAAMTGNWMGLTIRHAGFGVTNAQQQSGTNTKLVVSYAVRQITATEIESGANGKQTCNGDSGGPAFMIPPGGSSEVLVGVVSWGDQNCSVQGWDGRVDFGLAWIKPTMAAWETPTCNVGDACVPGCTPVDQDCVCVADGVCSSECLNPATDPDCPRDCANNGVCATQACGRPDPDCVALGGACISQFVCQTRVCITDAQHAQAYCSRACATSSECPSTMECRDGGCELPLRPTKQPFEICNATTEFCVDTVCSGLPQDAVTRCVRPCVSNADCSTGARSCVDGVGGLRFCQAATVPAAVLASADGSMTARLSPASSGCSAVGGLSPLLAAGLCLLGLTRRTRARGQPERA